MFAAAGWQVLTVKYGRLLEELFTRPGGEALRRRIDDDAQPGVPAAAALHAGAAARAAARDRRRTRRRSAALVAELDDDDAARRRPQPRRARPGRARRRASPRSTTPGPTVIFAYTVKGYGLATRGPPAEPLLAAHRRSRCGELARRSGTSTWTARGRRFDPDGRRRRGCAPRRRERLRRDAGARAAPVPPIPTDIGRTPSGTATTQAALGRALLDLTRVGPGGGAPGGHAVPGRQSSSTNLGGWVNKVGVWSARERVDWFADDPETILHWREQPERPAPGAGHRRDATWSGCSASWARPGPVGAAAAADRGALRPVRRAGAGAVVVRDLRGRAVDPGRHAVRGDAGARRAARTSRSPRRRSGWSSRAASATSPRSRSTSSGRCWPRWRGSAGPDGTSAYLRLSTRPVDQALAAVPDRPGRAGAPPPSGGGRAPTRCAARRSGRR